MAHSSLLQSVRPLRRTGTGLWLVGIVVLAILALAASVLANFSGGSPTSSDIALATPAFTKGDSAITPAPPSRAIPPGFQKRGTTLVGEMRTPDGMLIRLVLDGRTQTLIGAKIVESAPASR